METFVNTMNSILFFKLFGFPLILIWLSAIGVFLTIKFKFANIKMFVYSVKYLFGEGRKKVGGEVHHITPLQSFSAATAATLGLGNISGVAVAVAVGGPGSIVWMALFGFFSMCVKFAEITLGCKYREIKDNHVSGGPMYYLKYGLAEIGFKKLGKFLSYFYAAIFIFYGMVGGVLFQANQSLVIISGTEFNFETGKIMIFLSLGLTCLIGYIILGGVRRLGNFAVALVPFMCASYTLACIVVILVNLENLPNAINTILSESVNLNSSYGGLAGVITIGIQRALFSNEAGLGSSSIANSTSSTGEPALQGMLSSLEPFVDTVIMCTLTGIVIVVSGSHNIHGSGILMVRDAFATVSSWFPYLLYVIAPVFGFATIMSYSFYVRKSWDYLFKGKYHKGFIAFFLTLLFFGGLVSLKSAVLLADGAVLLLTIPNVLGLYMLSGIVKKELQHLIKTKNKFIK